MLSKKIRFRVFICCVLGIALLGAKLPASADEENYTPDEVLIKFKDTATGAQRAGLLREMGATIIKDFKYVGITYVHLHRSTVAEARARYGSHSLIDIFEPNYQLSVDLYEYPDDPMFNEQWGLHNTMLYPPSIDGVDIRAVHAWDVHRGSKSVIVGVIDTGCDIDHPDLIDNIYHNPGEIPGNDIDDDNNGYVDDVTGWNFQRDISTISPGDHGTLVSSTIGARANNGIGVSGVCWEVSIMPLQIFSGTGIVESELIASLNYSIMMGVHIINCSWGFTRDSETMRHAFEQVDSAGIYLVAAAGNMGVDINDYLFRFPVCMDLERIVVVTGISDEGDQIGDYGDERVDLAAPYQSTGCVGNGDYETNVGGTSFAAPFVSGTMALMMAKENLDPAVDYKARLLQSVDPRSSLINKCVTEGSLNAFLAIADPDYVAPSTIRNVTTKEIASNWIELEWTATGDDGGEGTASAYEFRRSSALIRNVRQFEKATLIETNIDPQPAGSQETLVIDGLEQGTTYYIAFRVFDEWGSYYYRTGGDYSDNTSGITKLKDLTTLGPPEIALAPSSIATAAQKWELNHLPFEIENNGVGTLDYEVLIPEEFPTITCYPATGSIQSGGSETITLYVNVDDFPCGANTAYIEVASNDGSNPLVTLPIELTVSGEARLEVEPAPIDYGLVIVGESSSMPVNLINRGCGPLTIIDMVSDNPDFNFTKLLELPAETTIQMPMTFEPSVYGEINATLTIIILGDGGPETIEIPLSGEGVTPPEMVMVPAEYPPQVLYTQDVHQEYTTIYNNGGYPLDVMLGWGGTPPWFSLSPELATIEPGDSLVVTATFNAQGYCDESLAGTLVIRSNDPDDITVEVPLSMTVIATGHIETSTSFVDWGDIQYLEKPYPLTFEILNTGCEGHPLTVTDLESSPPEIFEVVTATPFIIEPGCSYEVTVKLLTNPTIGVNIGSLDIYSDDPDDPVIEVILWVDFHGIIPSTINADGDPEVAPSADEPLTLNLCTAPNPFNPSTEVMFNLAKPGSVELRIYDVRGALVRAIDKGHCQSGPVSIHWNGSNGRGASVASGIYFYRVLSDGRQLGTTNKMVLLR